MLKTSNYATAETVWVLGRKELSAVKLPGKRVLAEPRGTAARRSEAMGMVCRSCYPKQKKR